MQHGAGAFLFKSAGTRFVYLCSCDMHPPMQPSAVESLEYFLGGPDDNVADRIAAWIPARGDRRSG